MITHTTMVLCALCGCVTVLLCTFAMKIANAVGLVDVPNAVKRHRTPTPLLGGIVLVGAVLPLSASAIFLPDFDARWGSMLLYVAATFAMSLVGLADDRHTLTARNRIVFAVLIFAVIAAVDPLFNVRVLAFATPRFELGLATMSVAVLFTTVCCVGLVNAVNMADGKNGLVISLCLGWIAILAMRAPLAFLPFLGLMAAGLVILLAYNLRGRLFLGDGGSYGFATGIGLLTIAIYNSPGVHAGRAMPAEQIMLLFAVPVLDSFRLTFARLARGQSPTAGDRDHLHHHLQDRFGWPKGLIVYLVIALAPSVAMMAFD